MSNIRGDNTCINECLKRDRQMMVTHNWHSIHAVTPQCDPKVKTLLYGQCIWCSFLPVYAWALPLLPAHLLRH